MNHDYLERMKLGIEEYLKDTRISQNQLAKLAGVSSSYITHALASNWEAVPASKGRTASFSSQIARKIMTFLGLDDTIWNIENYQKCFNTFIEAKKYAEHRIVSGERGSGKTKSAELFIKQYPTNSFLITLSDDMTPSCFVRELARQVGANPEGNRRTIRLSVENKIKELTMPVIIIDEAENAKASTMASVKALYDSVYKECGIVLIGANRFYETLEKRANRGTACFPQIFSRFSAAPALLEKKTLNDTREISALYEITDLKIVKNLHDNSQDFRELDRNIQRYLRDKELMNSSIEELRN